VDRAPRFFGISAEGAYDPAHVNELGSRTYHFGGASNIKVDKGPAPMNMAYGMRAALKAALARVEADIVEAGGELD
jgi:hypothetical protein